MENKNNSDSSNKSRGKAHWNTRLTELYIDQCIVEKEGDHYSGSHFTKTGWNRLIARFNELANRDYDKTQLKNKWDELKKKYKLWRQLIGKETGLGWDNDKQTIDASDEWWEERLKEVPEAKKFRDRGLEFADKLDRLFLGVAATGDAAWAPSIGTLPTQTTQEQTPVNIEEENDDYDVQDIEVPGEGSGLKKRRAKDRARKSSNARHMAQSLDSLIGILSRKEERQTSKSMRTDPPGCSFDEVVEQLNALPEIPIYSDLYYFALFLFEDKNERVFFNGLKEPLLKVGWLQRKQERGNGSFMSMMSRV